MVSFNMNKIPQYLTIFGYFLAIVLPSYRDRVYSKTDGKIELVSDTTVNMFTMGALGYIAAGILLAAIALQIFLLFKNHLKKEIEWVTIIIGLLALLFIDMPRTDVINASFNENRAFANSAPTSWGVLFIWIGILGAYMSMKVISFDSPTEFKEAVKEYGKNRTRKFLGPEMTHYVAMYILSLLAMTITFGIYAGFGRMLEGPAYYQQAILTYGLNRSVELSPVWDYLSFFTAPFIVTIIGLILFVLPAGGFAPNGPGVEQTQLESYFTGPHGVDFNIWGYFKMDIPFSEHYFGSFKHNVFYLIVVIMPIVVGGIIGALINYYMRNKNMSKFGMHMKNISIIIFVVSLVYAMLSAPVYISTYGFIHSMFLDRKDNYFLNYKWLDFQAPDNGNYHPMAIFTIGFMIFIPVMLYFTIIGNTVKFVLTGDYLKQKESVQIKGKYIDETISELPFEKETFTEKAT